METIKWLIIIVLILIVVGLWFSPGITKSMISGAAASVKSLAGSLA